jgi:hypothetical protein
MWGRKKLSGRSKKQYGCPECPLVTENYFSLINHLACIHFKEVILANSGPNNSCKLCDRSFSAPSSLSYHLNTIHKVLENFIPKKELLLMKAS